MKNINFLFLMLFFVACSCSNDNASESDYVNIPLDFEVPSNFPDLAYNLDANPPTEKGFELGKKLFYDGRLSSDGVISCGFCHEQATAFTHHGHTFSQGVEGLSGTRNTPSIQNLGFQTQFMYDGAADHMDLQPLLPIINPVEMNGNLTKIVNMLNADEKYVKLFAQAFPGQPINTENMLKAMSQFMVMMTSSNSKFDKFKRNEASGDFSEIEAAGYAIFNAKCVSCHANDLQTDNSFRNNGLAVNPYLNDVGRFRVTENSEDKYKFKVPSLRNVEKTAPYMHDGRFGSLGSVLDHYSSGVQNSATLDPLLNQNGKLGIPLSEDEKTNLITFLKTLTDNQYLTDKRFSE